MSGRRSRSRRSPRPLVVFLLGVALGAGLAVSLLLAQRNHGARAPAPPSAAHRPVSPPAQGPASPGPRPGLPQPAQEPPRQNPEMSRGPAIVPGPPHAPPGHPRLAHLFHDAGFGLRGARDVEWIGRPGAHLLLRDVLY